MNEILKALSLACNPMAPAKKEYYTELSDVRGGTTFFAKLCEELDFASTGSEAGNFCVSSKCEQGGSHERYSQKSL